MRRYGTPRHRTEQGWRRSDTPYSYGAVSDQPTGEQLVFFDLPRISPLQFNIPTVGITDRRQLIERIKAAIAERLEGD